MTTSFDEYSNLHALANEQTPHSSRPSDATHQLLQLAQDAELFHTPEKEPYATINEKGTYRTLSIREEAFKEWLLHRFYQTNTRAAKSQAMSDALATLEAQAKCQGPEHPVFIRIGTIQGAIFVDLANVAGQVVKITRTGWEVISTQEIRFRRSSHMRPLPLPQASTSPDPLFDFINITRETDKYLLLGWVLGAMHPTGPYPVLILQGEQGSAKTTASRFLRELIDPYTPLTRTPPRSEYDLIIGSKHSWVQSFDNVSNLSPDQSDALCRLSTGGGFGTRKLYRNDEEVLFSFERPVILNGISELATRQDLIDRAIILYLTPISSSNRLTSKEIRQKFQHTHPQLLGYLFSAISKALSRFETMSSPNLPRMADWATWVEAASPALGWPPQKFLDAYREHRQESLELSLEWDLVAHALQQLLTNEVFWEGTASDLLQELSFLMEDYQRRSRLWPATPKALSDRLRRSATALRSAREIDVQFKRAHGGNRTRLIRIEKMSVSCVPSVPNAPSSIFKGSLPTESILSDSTLQAGSQEKTHARSKKKTLQPNLRDGRDARDARVKTSTSRSKNSKRVSKNL